VLCGVVCLAVHARIHAVVHGLRRAAGRVVARHVRVVSAVLVESRVRRRHVVAVRVVHVLRLAASTMTSSEIRQHELICRPSGCLVTNAAFHCRNFYNHILFAVR